MGGKYGNLASAKQACDGNTNCLGVYEPYCNSRPKKNEFYLCPSDNGRKQIDTAVPFLNPSPSDINPCVHKKLKGKFPLYTIHTYLSILVIHMVCVFVCLMIFIDHVFAF